MECLQEVFRPFDFSCILLFMLKWTETKILLLISEMSLHLWWMHWLGDALERHGACLYEILIWWKTKPWGHKPSLYSPDTRCYQGRVLRKVTKTFLLHLRFPGANNWPPSLWNKRNLEHPELLRADCHQTGERGDRSAGGRSHQFMFD